MSFQACICCIYFELKSPVNCHFLKLVKHKDLDAANRYVCVEFISVAD